MAASGKVVCQAETARPREGRESTGRARRHGGSVGPGRRRAGVMDDAVVDGATARAGTAAPAGTRELSSPCYRDLSLFAYP
ncbi:hypothetical protein Plo01_30800 [Planobispora longispora]|uniref:Uncharacterized protein n=1 Tax=Planobispora longispora TaxID=28887 RepID=A0A8J3W6B0_9ACTN|nr:hypothetical protein Plo01_30800 [Planobispora longispora]